jgi:glycosyltransferase involved in cell wall biosynthesis
MHDHGPVAKKVAYLVNQYPKVSHTFIRREIHALEELGYDIARFSVRDTKADPKDDADKREAELTTVLLETNARGALSLARAALSRARKKPVSTWRALKTAVELARASDRPLQHLAYLAEAALLAEKLDAAGVEHVHAHFGTNSTTVALLAEQLGGPGFSFTAHGPEEFDRPELIALANKIEKARFVVGVSSFGKSQLMRRTAASSWNKVRVVPCGVDESFLASGIAKPIPEAKRLVCVGRICEQKGQLLLLEAAARLHDEGLTFELVLVGDGEMRPEADRFIAARGLERVVRITGWATGDRVRDEVNAARALVLPSFAEGLPVVIMEALALERPVISTYVAGIPELVETGKCGWLVPAGDVPALVEAMRSALSSTPEELEKLGREGRRRVLERHDARRAARALAEAFDGV